MTRLTVADIFFAPEVDRRGVFAYFAVFFCGIFIVLRSNSKRGILSLLYSLSCLALTWTLILTWFHEQAQAHESFESYNASPSLFVEAYELVRQTPEQWFWTCQLLVFVVPACSFLYSKLSSERVLAAGYMIAGFMGAISFRFLYFFTTSALPRKSRAEVSFLEFVCLAAALYSVAMMRTSTPDSFQFHLLILHFVLAIPVFLPSAALCRLPRRRVYAAIAFAATGMHLWSALAVVRAHSGHNLFSAILANLCQASITSDVILTFFSSAWLFCSTFGWRGAVLALATPLIGMGSAFAIFASWEVSVQADEETKLIYIINSARPLPFGARPATLHCHQ